MITTMSTGRRSAGLASTAGLAIAGILVIIVLSVLLWTTTERSDPLGGKRSLLLYCAAGIKPPVKAVVDRYREEFGVYVQIEYGGSGTLLSRIDVARIGDLYLAADDSYIDIGREKGLVAEAIPLANMKPVIAVAKGNPKGIRSVRDLLRKDVRVSCANPDAAAVGKIVKKALTDAGIWQELESRVHVFKPTVNDVANDLKLGAADVAIVWDATASQYPEFDEVSAPEFDRHPRQVTIGVLTSCERPAAALHFARYLGARDRGLSEFAASGYKPVDGDVWADVPEVVFFSGGVNRIAIQDTIEAFKEREGVEVLTTYNGCGVLVGQMKTGARPDAYFACDVSFMDNVGDLFVDAEDLAETDMVMLVAKGNPKAVAKLEDLAREGLKVGLANAEQSALGALTKRLLASKGILEGVMANVRSQTPTADLLVNQMRADALDVVVVYEANCSQVLDKLDVIHIDDERALAIQPIAVGSGSPHKYLMRRLVAALKTRTSRERFDAAGFRWRANLDAKLEGSKPRKPD